MTTVRIAKDWDWPNLLRQTPGGNGVWDGIRFTLSDEPCDLLVLLNNRMKVEVRATCPRNRIWALMQEPYVRGFTDWMVERHKPFSRVLTSHPPDSSPRYVRSQPAVPWHVDRTFDQLAALEMPEKTRPLSWIVGNCRDLPGHRDRLEFLRILQAEKDLPADLFGRAVRPIDDKWDGLAPYRYSLAVENTVARDYWTEKVADCFLSWSVPFYHGDPGLARYFPPDAFVPIDIRKPQEALAVIRRTLSEGEEAWRRRLPALIEARRRVLFEHQIFPYLAAQLRSEAEPPEARTQVVVPPYRRSFKASLWRKVGKAGMAVRRAKGAVA